MKTFLLLICVLFLSGCTVIGKFVTDVKTDGKGDLIVERSTVKYNWIIGAISTKDKDLETLHIVPAK